MTGRDDNTNTNSDTDPFDEKYGNMGQVLELNVIDFKPNMPKSKGFLFSDPVSVPRFEDLTIEGSFFTYRVYLIFFCNFASKVVVLFFYLWRKSTNIFMHYFSTNDNDNDNDNNDPLSM